MQAFILSLPMKSTSQGPPIPFRFRTLDCSRAAGAVFARWPYRPPRGTRRQTDVTRTSRGGWTGVVGGGGAVKGGEFDHGVPCRFAQAHYTSSGPDGSGVALRASPERPSGAKGRELRHGPRDSLPSRAGLSNISGVRPPCGASRKAVHDKLRIENYLGLEKSSCSCPWLKGDIPGCVMYPHGAALAERLDCSLPTTANRVQSPAGSLQIFESGNRAGRCRWSAGFLRDFPFALYSYDDRRQACPGASVAGANAGDAPQCTPPTSDGGSSGRQPDTTPGCRLPTGARPPHDLTSLHLTASLTRPLGTRLQSRAEWDKSSAVHTYGCGEYAAAPECQGRGERENPEKTRPASAIVRHDSRTRKSRR
ncbi:hypothetical protein PR048_023044 [Dryococelus australis]|uniref:Uncharacterized protein n=1 Tax=Dryococelus australis TaxID=614101 RepID=A0ABQ9GT18_9NEOP|nr:hypothetical protein PR048_023044 [Dryococelus australis]